MTAPLPRRIAWFAPWTWKRRSQITAIVVAVFAYPLGITPTILVAFKLRARGWLPGIVIELLLHAYKPYEFAVEHTPGASDWSLRYANFWHWVVAQTGL
jgi:hypothetical protein